MATEIVMPRLGWTMEQGTLVEWLKHDGDAVQAGEIIFTVESDKAVNEVESFESGILRIPLDSPAPGQPVPVGGLLAYLVQPGEKAPFEKEIRLTPNPSPPAERGDRVVADSPSPQVERGQGGEANSKMPTSEVSPAISPRARRIAAELGIDWITLKGSGHTGRIVERDIRAVLQAHPEQSSAESQAQPAARVTPVARRAAEQLNVNLNMLSDALPGKRIERADVERAAHTPTTPLPSGARTPIPRIRRIIAERMAASAHTTAPVTLTTEADATELVRLRKQLKNDSAARLVPTYNDLLIKIAAQALIEYPALNAHIEGDEIVQPDGIHIGLAVDSDRGLLVPVIRDVGAKGLRQIAEASAALIERARAGSLGADDLRGGTFTITNLGMYEIDAFTPIINLPECAILGVGRIVPKQVVIDAEAEQVAIRHMVFLSLTFDHRLVDGAPSARFLQRIKQFVEQPYLWLI